LFLAAGIATPVEEAGASRDPLAETRVGRTDALVPPFIDATDGIVRNGSAWDTDPSKWTHSATVAVRNSSAGEQVAKVRLRMDGKGDPLQQRMPQQSMFVYESSLSMGQNDSAGARCRMMSNYSFGLSAPDEIGAVRFNSSAAMPSGLTWNYTAFRDSLDCPAQGTANLHDGIKAANDELVPKKKAGFSWALILVVDGCWDSGPDPQAEVDRATQESIRIITLALFTDPNSSEKAKCEPVFRGWAQNTSGRYYPFASPAELEKWIAIPPPTQQTVLVYDDSSSMAATDPGGARCLGMAKFVDTQGPWSEVAVVKVNSTAALLQPLTEDRQAAKAAIRCGAEGSNSMRDALRIANDELIPRKKPGLWWRIVVVTDGCWESGPDPLTEVARAAAASVAIVTIGLFPDPNTEDWARCEPQLRNWSTQTGGGYNWHGPRPLQDIYRSVAFSNSSGWKDAAGSAPKTGASMVLFKLASAIEVVPGSFACASWSCGDPLPSNAAEVVEGNKGLWLKWKAPVDYLRLRQYWQVEFGVRSYLAGKQIKVNDVANSFVEYDRYDGSPGGSDVFEQAYLDAVPDPAPYGTVEGLVTDSLTGLPLPGAQLVFHASGVPVGLTQTDSSGRYSIAIPPGELSVALASPGYVQAVRNVTVLKGETTFLDVALDPLPAVVRGKVSDRDTRRPLEGVLAVVYRGSTEFARATASSDGKFEIGGLPHGSYRLVLSKPGYEPRNLSLSLAPGETVEVDELLTEVPSPSPGSQWPGTLDWVLAGLAVGMVIGLLAFLALVRRARTRSRVSGPAGPFPSRGTPALPGRPSTAHRDSAGRRPPAIRASGTAARRAAARRAASKIGRR
jgi:hypothetical protein